MNDCTVPAGEPTGAPACTHDVPLSRYRVPLFTSVARYNRPLVPADGRAASVPAMITAVPRICSLVSVASEAVVTYGAVVGAPVALTAAATCAQVAPVSR